MPPPTRVSREPCAAPAPWLPYARQQLDEEDIAAVVEALRAPFITSGPRVTAFEAAVASAVGVDHGVAVSSGTAALHAALFALGVGPGDEVIVPPMTFAATANVVVHQGAVPVFADVAADTLLLDPGRVEAKLTPRTKAVVAVDYAGQPCDYEALRAITDRHGLGLVADGCHALGGAFGGRAVGGLADLTAFSFHPVKPITTGEGGMITTNDAALAERMRRFRNHGITADHAQREREGSWIYEISELGYNYRLTDIQCALGLRQLAKLPDWVARRQAIAHRYHVAFDDLDGVQPLRVDARVVHAYHLYVVRVEPADGRADRRRLFAALRQAGIGANVHYIPVHVHPFYRKTYGTGPGLCPVAEAAYERILSLPMFPAMQDEDVDRVIGVVTKVMSGESTDTKRSSPIRRGGAAPQDIRWRGATVSRMTLGTAQLGAHYGIANRTGKPTPDEAHALVSTAWKHGTRVFDTAQAYGDSEAVLGEALRRLTVQHEARVITKLAPERDPADCDALRAAVAASRQRLGVDRLWGLMLHREGWLDAWDDGLGETLCALRESGQVRHLGVSVYTVEAAGRALGHPDLDMVQVACNAWDQRMLRAGVFASARAADKLCFVRSVYLQGLLTLSPEAVATRRPGALPAAREWWRLAETFGITPVQLAMRFALSLGAPLVIGCESAEQIVRNHVLLGEHPLDGDACAQIHRALAPRLDEHIMNPARWPPPMEDRASVAIRVRRGPGREPRTRGGGVGWNIRS